MTLQPELLARTIQQEKAMTAAALYQDFWRFSLSFIGLGALWIAVFLALIWRLHYEPERIK
jgi:hypothetical protein